MSSDFKYLLHDRDSKFSAAFLETLRAVGVKPVKLPARSPNVNAHCERWIGSAKRECVSKFIICERMLRRLLREYEEHHHYERNHQGKGNELLFVAEANSGRDHGEVLRKKRLGGVLSFYHRQAA